MSAPFKRLCLRAARQQQHQTPRQWHLAQQPYRSLSNTAPKPATPTPTAEASPTSVASSSQPSDEDLDRLIGQPGVTYTTSEEADDIGSVDISTLSSKAQRELDSHRELREMVRLAAWEMPLLTCLAKPFTPPDRSSQYLRWRYTTYMGESHPAESKVVLEFKPFEIPELTRRQRIKLKKIAGPRYDPLTETVKMSCDSFETQAQNKRYLVDTLQELVREAQDPQGDSFKDVPLDLRHVKKKKEPKFPEQWRMTEERRRALDADRKEVLLLEAKRVEEGRIISGVGAIEETRRLQEEARRKALEERDTEPVTIGGRTYARMEQGKAAAQYSGMRKNT